MGEKKEKKLGILGIIIIIAAFILVIALIALLIVDIVSRKAANTLLENSILAEAEIHDLVTEDNGIFGYTAIDF